MEIGYLAVFFCFFFFVNTQPSVQGQGCLQYVGGDCVSCPYQYHPYGGMCFADILGCLKYAENIIVMCVLCDNTYTDLDPTTGYCKPRSNSNCFIT